MNQNISIKRPPLNTAVLCSLIVIAAAQINVNLYLNNFKISIAVILLPVFVFLWEPFPLIRTAVLSGFGVFISRIVIDLLKNESHEILFGNYLPEAFFYVAYGILLYFLCRRSEHTFSHLWDIAALILIDYAANLTELLLRFGASAFTGKTQTSIILVAVFRSAAAIGAISVIKRSHLLLLKREHAERYRKLILLISKLNGEIIWMKKNSALIEQTMNRSYQLYKDLDGCGIPESITGKALETAKDIHEIKKEYFIILKGISDAMELNLKDDGMYLADILKLLKETFTSSSDKSSPAIDFRIQCDPSLYTDRHYFFISVFHNLFINAAEASSPEPVSITFSQTDTDTHYLFCIEDSGPGIPSEEIDQIFYPGYSTKINYQTGEVSRGLGLNLVQDLVENQLCGTVAAVSEPGRTIFTIAIPKSEIKVVS